jgi:hypothetical protein
VRRIGQFAKATHRLNPAAKAVAHVGNVLVKSVHPGHIDPKLKEAAERFGMAHGAASRCRAA